MLLREAVGVGFDDDMVEPVLCRQRFEALRRILGEQIHFALLDGDVMDALRGHRAHDAFEVIDAHRLFGILAAEFIHHVQACLLEPPDHARAFVFAQRHVVFGNFEAGNGETRQQRDQAVDFIAVPRVFEQDAAGKGHHAGIAIQPGRTPDHIAGDQQRVHRVDLGVVDVLRGDLEQVGDAALAAGPAERVRSEVDHRGDAAAARLAAARRQGEFRDGVVFGHGIHS